MPFKNKGKLSYYTFSSLSHSGNTHAIFTRLGGSSPPPWKSLNVGALVGDDKDIVKNNRTEILRAMSRDPDSMFDVWQVHGNNVVIADEPRKKSIPYHKADAILTNNPDVTLFMRFADCVPILLYDPVKKAVGIVHAGWLGTVKKIVKFAVESFQNNYGSRVENMIVGIGPSIAAHHYTVGNDVVKMIKKAFPNHWSDLLTTASGGTQLDLWESNRLQLQIGGVSQVEISNICTACDLNNWYSHRGENGKTGRFAALIGLNP